MKRKIAIILLVTMMVSMSGVFVSAKELIRRPYDNYYSVQNPPDFSWPYTHGATYSLKVATNEALTENVVEITGLKKNLYNFSTSFEPGEYYWSYKINNGIYKEVFRFYIAENSTNFSVTTDCENLTLPSEHPRILINKDTLPYLKNVDILSNSYIRLTEDAEFDNSLQTNIEDNIPVHPGNLGTSTSKITSKFLEPAKKTAGLAMLYHITDNEKYKTYAIKYLNALTIKDETTGAYIWDPETTFTWNSNTDVNFAIFAWYIALSYDWLYNYLTEEERENAISLIDLCLKKPYEEWASGTNLSSNLYMSFVGAHNYRLNQCLIAALSIYDKVGDESYAHKIVSYHLPIALNFTQPFSYQDGGGAQGNFYGIGTEFDELMFVLDQLEIADIKNKPIVKNMAYRFLYLWNTGETSAFGDNYNTKPEDTYQYKTMAQKVTANVEDKILSGVNKWLLSDATKGEKYYTSNYYSTAVTGELTKDIEEIAPDMFPNAKYFKDIGWVSLNSSLSDKNRVSMRFKSSPYGSYNHSHPDQNSFVISAFGEYLAIDSDYYDSMHSAFDIAWNRKTYAHNAITYDGGNGQPYNNISATGYISQFLPNKEIDIATGDATVAYNKANADSLEKSKRNIIYIKPDIFIIVDDIKSANGRKQYEFWLQTKGNFEASTSNSATISQNGVYMFSDAIHPSVTSTVYEGFKNPDGTALSASTPSIAANATDKRIMYKTNTLLQTKMVNAISVSENSTKPCTIKKTTSDGVIKLTVTDTDTGKNTFIYINEYDASELTVDNITFKGDIAVVSENSKMLVNGTKLYVDNNEIITSDVNVSAGICDGRLSLSSIDEDATVKVYTGSVNEIHKTEDEKEIKLKENEYKYGVKYVNTGDYTTFNIYNGAYTFDINDSLHDGYVKTDVNITGNGKVINETPSRVIKDYNNGTTFKIEPDDGYYIESITFNGNEVSVNNENIYKTPVITENSTLNVKFSPIESTTTGETKTVPCAFSYNVTDGRDSVIVFGKLNRKGLKVKEWGVIYSYNNENLDLESVDGTSIRRLKSEYELASDGSFGIEIHDLSENCPEYMYVKGYAIYEDNDAVDYGDIIKVTNKEWGMDAYIEDLYVSSGMMYPAFSPETENYIVGAYSDNLSDIFSYSLPYGATAEVINATAIGETSKITVTSANGNKKTYTFRLSDISNFEGISYGTENTTLSVRDAERQLSDSEYNLSTKSDMNVCIYRYNKDAERYAAVKFDLKDVNMFGGNIYLQYAVSNFSNSLKTANFAVYDVICDDSVSLAGRSFNNTFGNGSFKLGEKIAIVPLSQAKISIDVTEYIRKKFLEGEDTVTIIIMGDRSTWGDEELDTSSDRGIKNIFIRRVNNSVTSNRPAIRWEGE